MARDRGDGSGGGGSGGGGSGGSGDSCGSRIWLCGANCSVSCGKAEKPTGGTPDGSAAGGQARAVREDASCGSGEGDSSGKGSRLSVCGRLEARGEWYGSYWVDRGERDGEM